MTSDLTSFVLTRAAEREALAQAAQLADGPWVCGTSAGHLVDTVVYRPSAWTGRIVHACNTEYAGAEAVHVAEFIAHHDPARALREVAAVRAIVTAFEQREREAEQAAVFGHHATGLLLALRHLASVDSDHPDYRPEWST